ncbi:aconitate decarboxylase [Humitalea rosea]|uniref:Aconitate decarboxylase n=1 Tax=Humitalea rosea TaxID=990373 RepID=A0A2W7HXP9_9PROT|nr:MmgE/PrpD family protein [Humitalea rosea]PZW38699.1 aconitate decarboxylase [Humitalea rosea]
MSGSATRAFADALLARAQAGLGPAASATATDLLRDGVAVACLGALEPAPRILARLARETGGAAEATLFAQTDGPALVPAEAAARANGAAMHVLDYEPMWNPANHALSTTLPAVLALAERQARLVPGSAPDGARILLALALGIEAQARLRLASGQFEPGQLLFHPPGMVGAIGSAVACGLLLGLDAEGLTHAMGIAASRAGGVIANVGSMTKCLHCGDAAAAGLGAAMLAARGFTADADAIGSPRGWGRAFSGAGYSAAPLTAAAEDWHITAPGPAFKLFPSQYGTHFVITAALAARRGWDGRSAIRRVSVTAPAMAYVDRPLPASGLAGKFSFQFCVAAALLDGRVGVESFSDARRFAPDLAELLGKIEILPDPLREGRFDRMRVEVAVTLENGQVLEGRCDGPPGIWGRPVPPGVLAEKWRNCFAAALGETAATAVLAATSDVAARGPDAVLAVMAASAVANSAYECIQT